MKTVNKSETIGGNIMQVVDQKPIPIYEVECHECHSKIQYRKAEVGFCSITCPICGVSVQANTLCPVRLEDFKQTTIPDKYKIDNWKVVWEDQPDIGYYTMHIEDADGNEVSGTDIWLRDYTGPVQRDLRKGTRYENIAFEIGYTCGYSYRKSYEFSDGRTLEDMKRECEQYIVSVLNNRIKNAKTTLEETEPICKWFNEWILKNHKKVEEVENGRVDQRKRPSAGVWSVCACVC